LPEAAPSANVARRRRRRVAIGLTILLVVLLAGFLLLRWALQPERLGALLLQRAATATGLELDVSRPATLGIWPGLQVELIGLSARMPGDTEDLLRAERVAVGLPLAVLWSDGDVELGELRLLQPVVDVGAVQRWLSRDAGDARSPPRLPPLALSIDASDGRLHGDGWAIAIESLEATPLRSDEPFTLTTVVTLLRDGQGPLPVRLRLAATPSQAPDGISFDELQAAIGTADRPQVLQLAGMLGIEADSFAADASLQFGETWPEAWPPLPPALAARLPGRRFDIDHAGGPGLDGRLQIASAADAAEPLRVDVVPSRLLAWLRQPEPKTPLPPADIAFGSERVEIDGVVIEGLRVELRDVDRADD